MPFLSCDPLGGTPDLEKRAREAENDELSDQHSSCTSLTASSSSVKIKIISPRALRDGIDNLSRHVNCIIQSSFQKHNHYISRIKLFQISTLTTKAFAPAMNWKCFIATKK